MGVLTKYLIRVHLGPFLFAVTAITGQSDLTFGSSDRPSTSYLCTPIRVPTHTTGGSHADRFQHALHQQRTSDPEA